MAPGGWLARRRQRLIRRHPRRKHSDFNVLRPPRPAGRAPECLTLERRTGIVPLPSGARIGRGVFSQ